MDSINHLVILGAFLLLGLTTTLSISYISFQANAKEEVLNNKLDHIESKMSTLKVEIKATDHIYKNQFECIKR
ncbi:MAG: hypothetical protein KAH10_02010 [Flavobacteriales bacterium]|nr:hypothetical protein [Flavobacteriales bacterium]